jgi:pyridoxal phosphate enzyme (YggS family)
MITQNLQRVKEQIPANVKLVAVSKTYGFDEIMEAYNSGQRVFGENKVQELTDKYEALPKDIEWHLIGHLQTNKVKYIAPFVHTIHAVDSFKLLQEIDKRAQSVGRVINCLLQFHIAQEDTKFGLSENELDFLEDGSFKNLKNIKICGVMGMATFTDNTHQIQQEFAHLKQIYNRLKTRYFATDNAFCEISMGMSGDYPLAIAAGSTIVRVGSHIFGQRN